MFTFGFLSGILAVVVVLAIVCFSDRATNAVISLIEKVRSWLPK